MSCTVPTVVAIREKRPGYWEVRVFAGVDESGRKIQVSRTLRGTKRDAQRLAAQLTLRPTPAAGRKTVAELIELFVTYRSPTWSLQTRSAYESRVRILMRDPIVNLPVARVGVAEIDAWHYRMRKAGTREPTIHNNHAFLRAVFQQAVRWEWITHNPVALATLRRPKAEPRGVMSPEEVQAVLTAAAEINRAAHVALRLAAVAGARRAELAAMRWDKVYDGSLLIDHQITPDRTKGADDPDCYVYAPTKTANRRVVTLDERTLRYIAELRLERQAITPWMFGTSELPVAPDRIGWWWTRSRAMSGIDKRWRLHDLRHFSATQAIAGGHDIRSVAARLGHADPSMTLRVYAHALTHLDRRIAGTMASVIDGSRDLTVLNGDA
jgi:integrase